MVLGKCCCCVDLRVGSIVIAIIGFVGGFGNLGVSLKQDGAEWSSICFAISQSVASGCLLYGAIKREKTPTLIYLAFEMVSIILLAIIIILTIIAMLAASSACQSSSIQMSPVLRPGDNCADLNVGFAVVIAVYAAFLALSIYFWICVHSFLKGLNGEQSSSPRVATV